MLFFICNLLFMGNTLFMKHMGKNIPYVYEGKYKSSKPLPYCSSLLIPKGRWLVGSVSNLYHNFPYTIPCLHYGMVCGIVYENCYGIVFIKALWKKSVHLAFSLYR